MEGWSFLSTLFVGFLNVIFGPRPPCQFLDLLRRVAEGIVDVVQTSTHSKDECQRRKRHFEPHAFHDYWVKGWAKMKLSSDAEGVRNELLYFRYVSLLHM